MFKRSVRLRKSARLTWNVWHLSSKVSTVQVQNKVQYRYWLTIYVSYIALLTYSGLVLGYIQYLWLVPSLWTLLLWGHSPAPDWYCFLAWAHCSNPWSLALSWSGSAGRFSSSGPPAYTVHSFFKAFGIRTARKTMLLGRSLNMLNMGNTIISVSIKTC